MARFVGLEVVAGGELEGPADVKSVTRALRELRTHRVVSGAGALGSFTVWIDDHGYYQMEFSRFKRVVSRLFSRTKSGLKRWLKEWLPQCQFD